MINNITNLKGITSASVEKLLKIFPFLSFPYKGGNQYKTFLYEYSMEKIYRTYSTVTIQRNRGSNFNV